MIAVILFGLEVGWLSHGRPHTFIALTGYRVGLFSSAHASTLGRHINRRVAETMRLWTERVDVDSGAANQIPAR